MAPRIGLTVIMLFYALRAFAGSAAFADGEAAATTTLGNSAGGVTQTNVDALGNPYGGNTNTLQGTFASSNAGNTGLSQNGQDQLSACQNQPASGVSTTDKQYCDGVNALALNPLQNAQTKTGLTKTDSIFTNPNSAYNLGMSATATTSASVGSGTPQDGTAGVAACLTSTQSTPATYTTSTCVRATAPSAQACQKTIAPTVESVPYCTLSGTSTGGPWCTNTELVTGGDNYTVTYSCRDPSDPLYALGGIATISHTAGQGPWLWQHGGGRNNNIYSYSFNFTLGVTSPVAYSAATVINYDGTLITYTSAFYDGPTDTIYVTDSNLQMGCLPFGQGCNAMGLASCAPGYTYSPPIYFSYTSGQPDPITGVVPTTDVTIPPNCQSPSDPSSIPYPQGVTVLATYTAGQRISWGYLDPFGNLLPQYLMAIPSGFGNPSVGQCSATWCKIETANPCRSGFTLYPVIDPLTASPAPLGICHPSSYTVSMPQITNDRAVRMYSPLTPHYQGSAGVNKVLHENLTDSCAPLQQQTDNPTAIPATAINGTFTCPTGKTLNGSYCY